MTTQSTTLAVSFAVLLAAVGCSSSTTTPSPSPSPSSTGTPGADGGGVTTTPTPDAGTPTSGGTCDINTGSPQCDACFKQSCCAQLAACDADTDCVALDTCLDKCGDPSTPQAQQCGDACYQQHPQGAAKADAIDACVEKSCKTACQ